MDPRKMTDTDMVNTIAMAYQASYRLERKTFQDAGPCFYWVSDLDPQRREIAGTRGHTLRQTVMLGTTELAKSPLTFVEPDDSVTCFDVHRESCNRCKEAMSRERMCPIGKALT